MKRVVEKANAREYFLGLAGQYEKNGFLVAAALIYRRFDNRKAKRLYRLIAKEAQLNGLYHLAAEAYGLAGQDKMARTIRRYYGNPKEDMFYIDVLNGSDGKNFPLTKILFATTRFEREGMFDYARKHWMQAARYCERFGEYMFASLYYFKCGQLRDAKRMWQKFAVKEMIVS